MVAEQLTVNEQIARRAGLVPGLAYDVDEQGEAHEVVPLHVLEAVLDFAENVTHEVCQ